MNPRERFVNIEIRRERQKRNNGVFDLKRGLAFFVVEEELPRGPYFFDEENWLAVVFDCYKGLDMYLKRLEEEYSNNSFVLNSLGALRARSFHNKSRKCHLYEGNRAYKLKRLNRVEVLKDLPLSVFVIDKRFVISAKLPW
jgi:hypothetical protein